MSRLPHATTCPLCRVLDAAIGKTITHFTRTLGRALTQRCWQCEQPWGKHAIEHPHVGTGKVPCAALVQLLPEEDTPCEDRLSGRQRGPG